MQMLASRVSGGDNNFDFIRWLAATMVVFSHEFALIPGAPLLGSIHTLGALGLLGVDIFFVVSGFLVTRSLIERSTLGLFAAARLLRIVPGLLVMLLLTTFVLGPLVTTLPVLEYFTRREIYAYFAHNLLLFDIHWTLPGVFMSNPGLNAVNGSLWSLWPEIQMYGVLLGLGVLALAWSRMRMIVVGVGMLGAIIIGFLYHGDLEGCALEPNTLARLAPYFGIGGLLYLGHRWVPVTFVMPVVLGLGAIIAHNNICFAPLFTLAIATGTIWFAYTRLPLIARWGRFGDVSYGLYIYAFPLQQALIAICPGLNRWTHFILVYPLILLVAWLSWRWVEAPALALKRWLWRFYSQQRSVAGPQSVLNNAEQ